MVKRVSFEGRTYEFPDDASDEEIASALNSHAEPAPRSAGGIANLITGQPQRVSQGEDLGRSVLQGAQEIPGIILGLPGDVQRLVRGGVNAAGRFALRTLGKSDEEIDAIERAANAYNNSNPATRLLPGSGDITQAVEGVTGYHHDPQTVPGEYARTITQFAPAMLTGEGEATLLARGARTLVPAVTTETTGQVVRQVAPEYEDAARVAAALGSGIATEAGIARGARARPAGPPPDPDEFLPRTRGERTGDPRAIQRENELRRAGPGQAQTTLRNFDDERAAALQDNLMRRVATRGRDPNTESLGDAGVVLADDLRSGYEAMRGEQATRYARARELAGDAPLAPTDELGANVGRVVDENFLNEGEGVAVLRRLDGMIRKGSATYANVEQARQRLNVLLGDAMRSGTGADVVAIHRLIDTLDEFVQPRLNPEAQAAMREARGYTSEMLNMYGEQARPDLSTGHTGRTDSGGRVIKNILGTDMTGEQVMDSIFGVSNQRPSRAALSAVRRIHDRATRSISTGGYEAPTANEGRQQRVRGRQTLRGGRSTRGGREFDPSEAQRARFGNEAISDPALQALREAFVYRLLRRMQNREAGDVLPAKTMANDLRAALNGSGSEITPLLFNGEEMALMRRALADLESVSPPSGQYNPSAPGIAQDAAERSFAAIAGRILGRVPGLAPIGQAIEEGVVNGRAIRDAREAVRQPSAQAPQARRTQPSAAAVVYEVIAAPNGQYAVGDRKFNTREEAEAYARFRAANSGRR